MFIGHYPPAFIAAASPKSPRFGALFVAAQLIDIAFFAFLWRRWPGGWRERNVWHNPPRRRED